MTSRSDKAARAWHACVNRLSYREAGGRSRGITVCPEKATGMTSLCGGRVTSGVRVRVPEMALVPGTQVLQVSSQQLPSHPCSQFREGSVPDSWCCISAMDPVSCMACCIWAQCDSLSVAGMSGIAQAPRSGAIANASVIITSSNFCSRLFI